MKTSFEDIRDELFFLRKNKERLCQLWRVAKTDSHRDNIGREYHDLQLTENRLAVKLNNLPSEPVVVTETSSGRLRMADDSEFTFLKGIYKAMDSFFLDPIIGFFIPGAGDVITATLTIPFIYTSLLKERSIPLTLAVISNALIDMLLGLFPVIGDIIDVFNRAYKRNYKLIVGYVEEDPEVLRKISGEAAGSALLISILCIIIRLVVLAFASLFGWFKGLFA